MTEIRVRALPVYNGWEGEFRKIGKAGWHKVEVNGVTQLFDTADKAKIAAYEAMDRHHFGTGILSDGEAPSSARSEAEKLFGCIFAKGRKIEVERR